MPYRLVPIVSGEIYHVFNRSIARQSIFLNKNDYQRKLETVQFYSYGKGELRFSHYNRLSLEQRKRYLYSLKENSKKEGEILAFCFMPNHFHFLIKQLADKGISNFMRHVQNSYAKYFNIKTERVGALFQQMFKVKIIENDEQLIHVARYIHLNPFSSYVIRNIEELASYPWSSYMDYIEKRRLDFLSTDLIWGYFSSRKEFEEFTLDQADYQREIEKIKHLLLE